MLLSDGSVTRHLALLTGLSVRVECLEMAAVPPAERGGLPGAAALIEGPLVQRQVLLHIPDPHSRAFVYAASWWSAATVDRYLRCAVPGRARQATVDRCLGCAVPGRQVGWLAAARPHTSCARSASPALPRLAPVHAHALCRCCLDLCRRRCRRDRSQPIWASLSQERTELYREILTLEYGSCPFLEE
jgi:hypothetical protein